MSLKEQLGSRRPGEIITELKDVEIREVYKWETGTGKYGEYTRQNFIIADGDTEVRGTIWNSGNLKPLIGQTVTMRATTARTGEWKGIKLKINEHNGQKRKELDLNSFAAFYDENNKHVRLAKEEVKSMPKANYTPEELLALYNYWKEKGVAVGDVAKMVGCSMVIQHKIEGPDAEDLTGLPEGRGKEPHFNDDSIPF